MQWDIEVGQKVTRQEVMDAYGGTIQGGIQPSRKTPNIMLYTDLTKAEKHGYTFDGWSSAEDDVFYYSGQGLLGDQSFRSGNKTIRDHKADGRALRLFELAERRARGGDLHTYLGEFELDEREPYRIEQALDEEENSRQLIVFKLRLAGEGPRAVKVSNAALVDTEANVADEYQITPSLNETAMRREAKLMALLEQTLTEQGHVTKRWKITPEGSSATLYTDTYDETEGVLWELKASADRASVRMAIGQLADYLRYLPEETKSGIVLPNEPAKDVVDLIHSQNHRLLVVSEGEVLELEIETSDPSTGQLRLL